MLSILELRLFWMESRLLLIDATVSVKTLLLPRFFILFVRESALKETFCCSEFARKVAESIEGAIFNESSWPKEIWHDSKNTIALKNTFIGEEA